VCGIVGFVNVGGRVGWYGLTALSETLRARGPDGGGQWWGGDGGLAMRRLAIIDLDGGEQPILSEDGQIALVINGEIYNYRELRAELQAAGHIFKSAVDVEVVVHGYEEWGIEGMLRRLDGMFALALWDRRRNRIFLARDRFGEKPLYLARDRETVAFASYLLTAVGALSQTPAIDAVALQWYWALHYVPGDRTIFEGVRRLRAGEAYELDATRGGTIRRWRYWRLSEHGEKDQDANELRELVRRAVRSRMVADVPVGVFLSGGIDSSMLTALAAAAAPGIHTFSVGFASEAHDESPHAMEVAQAVGATHHAFEFGANEFRDLIPGVVAAMDEPIGDQAMLPVFALAGEAAKHVKVVLSGEGADELFGGYSYYHDSAAAAAVRFRRWRRRNKSEGVPAVVSGSRMASGFPLVTPHEIRTALSPGSLEAGAWEAEVSAALGDTLDPLRRATLCDIETWLSEDLLMKADKMTMAHSLESRAPFLAPELAVAAFALPARAKVGGVTKVRLREAAQGILPASIVSRPKQGFVLPMDEWLRRDLYDDFIDAIRVCDEPLIDRRAMESAVQQDRDGVKPLGGRALYPMLVIVRWLAHAEQALRRIRAEVASADDATVSRGPVLSDRDRSK